VYTYTHGCCCTCSNVVVATFVPHIHVRIVHTSTTVLLFSRLDSAMSTLYFFLGLFLGCSLSGTHLFLFHLIVIYYVNVCMCVHKHVCTFVNVLYAVCRCVWYTLLSPCVFLSNMSLYTYLCVHITYMSCMCTRVCTRI
jgi:hypothetical protein